MMASALESLALERMRLHALLSGATPKSLSHLKRPTGGGVGGAHAALFLGGAETRRHTTQRSACLCTRRMRQSTAIYCPAGGSSCEGTSCRPPPPAAAASCCRFPCCILSYFRHGACLVWDMHVKPSCRDC